MERQATLVGWMFFWVVNLNVWVLLSRNQIHGFGCPAFEIGTTWIFLNFEHCTQYQALWVVDNIKKQLETATSNDIFWLINNTFCIVVLQSPSSKRALNLWSQSCGALPRGWLPQLVAEIPDNSETTGWVSWRHHLDSWPGTKTTYLTTYL